MRALASSLLFASFSLVFGCGNTTEGSDASVDAPVDSPSNKDGTVADASADAPSDAQGSDASDAGPTDAASDACGTSCRLFSDYCQNAPCTCLALPSTKPDPTGDAGTVSCLVDPCGGKAAVCTPSGCVVQ